MSKWLVTDDRCERVQMCLDYLARRKQELTEQFPDCQIVVETESKANVGGLFGRTDWYGTCDITITVLNPNGGLHFLEVIDYKDGRGWVHHEDNSQLLSYCGGKMRPYIGSGDQLVRPFRTNRIGACRMTIVQPKTNPPVRYQDCSPDHVITKLEVLNFAAHATDKPDAPLTAGKHCEWCKANPKRGGNCTTAYAEKLEVIKTMTTDIVVADNKNLFEVMSELTGNIDSLTNDQLSQFADAKEPMVQAFERVEAEIQRRLELGQKVSGYEMGNGNSSYIWNADEETIVKALKGRRLKLEDIYPPKLISPAQMKKLPSSKLTPEQKKRLEKDFITQKIGKWTLKRVTRKEQPTVQETFASVIEQPQEISFF